MRARYLWAVGIGAYVVFAIATLPAGTAYRWLAPQGVELTGLRGTAWSGRAERGAAAGLAAEDIRWQIVPWALALGRLAAHVDLRLPDGFASADVSATRRSVEFRDLRLSASLTGLTSLMPGVAAGTRGLLSLMLKSLRLENFWPVEADGELRLSKLEVPPLIPAASRSLIPLGDYRVEFTPSQGRGLTASITDTGGPLELSDTTLKLTPDRRYELRGHARPRPQADPLLAQGLDLVATGNPDASGKREFNLSGSL